MYTVALDSNDVALTKMLLVISNSATSNIVCEEHPWKLTEKCIEDAWFVYTLVDFYKSRGVLSSTNFASDKTVSQKLDVDAMFEMAWEKITSATNPWIHHKCGKVGCSEGEY